jgi:hypothetical protein
MVFNTMKNTKQYDKHVLDYIEFNEEQVKWFEEVDRHNRIRHEEWLAEYIKDLPFEVKCEI